MINRNTDEHVDQMELIAGEDGYLEWCGITFRTIEPDEADTILTNRNLPGRQTVGSILSKVLSHCKPPQDGKYYGVAIGPFDTKTKLLKSGAMKGLPLPRMRSNVGSAAVKLKWDTKRSNKGHRVASYRTDVIEDEEKQEAWLRVVRLY